jgi:hypothetical protein
MEQMNRQSSRNVEWVLISLPVVAFAVWVGLHMQGLGFRIPQPHLGLDYAMGVFWWVIIAIAICTFTRESRQMLLWAWTGKFFVVLIAMLFYEQYYYLDGYAYFERHMIRGYWEWSVIDFRKDMLPSLQPLQVPGDDGPPVSYGIGFDNTLRFMLLLGKLTGPFYHAMKVGCAFLGLLGAWWFYRAIVVALGRPYPSAFYLLAFFPSIIFWSSILGKDPIQFLFLGLYAYGGAVWLVEGRLTSVWFIGAGLFGAYLLRPWIGLMGGAALFLATLLGRSRGWQIGVMLVVCGPILFVVADHASSLLNISPTQSSSVISSTLQVGALEVLQSKAEGFSADTQRFGGSGADITNLTSGGSLDAALPLIMFSGLFRPLPFDITNPFTALAAVENTAVLLLAIVALFRFRLAYIRDPLLLWLIIYALMWTAFYGFIVLANFGSGVRYKLQVWPFLLMAILLLTHKEGRALLASRIPGVRRTVEHT